MEVVGGHPPVSLPGKVMLWHSEWQINGELIGSFLEVCSWALINDQRRLEGFRMRMPRQWQKISVLICLHSSAQTGEAVWHWAYEMYTSSVGDRKTQIWKTAFHTHQAKWRTLDGKKWTENSRKPVPSIIFVRLFGRLRFSLCLREVWMEGYILRVYLLTVF